MKQIIQILKEKDLLKRNEPNEEQVKILSLSQIIDLSSQIDSVLYEVGAKSNNKGVEYEL